MNFFENLVNETFEILKFIFFKLHFLDLWYFNDNFFRVSQNQLLGLSTHYLAPFFLLSPNKKSMFC